MSLFDPNSPFANTSDESTGVIDIPKMPKIPLSDGGVTPLPKLPAPPVTLPADPVTPKPSDMWRQIVRALPQTPPATAAPQPGIVTPTQNTAPVAAMASPGFGSTVPALSPSNPDPRQGQPVPGMPGYVYNWAGGQEPIGNGGQYGGTYVPPDTANGFTGPNNAATNTAGLQATAPPSSYVAPPPDANVASMIASFIQQNGLTANQSDPASLFKIVQYLRSNNINAQVDYTDQNGHTGGILVNGHPYQLIDGNNNWTALQPWESSGDSSSFGGGSATGGRSLDTASIGLDDPATLQLLQYIQSILPQLTTPVNDPARAQLAALAQQQIANLSAPMQTPAETQAYKDLITKAIQQLSGPAYSDEQLAQIRTGAFDTLNRQEQAEIDNTIRQLANRGVPPDSGIVSHAVQEVRNKYIIARGQQQQQLNSAFIDADTARRGQLLSTAQAGSNLGLAEQQTQEQRTAQILPIISALVNANSSYRSEDAANQNKALSLYSLPVDITERRVANAVNASSGQAVNPQSIIQTLSSYLNGAQNQTNQNAAQSAAYWQNLGSALSQIDWAKVFG